MTGLRQSFREICRILAAETPREVSSPPRIISSSQLIPPPPPFPAAADVAAASVVTVVVSAWGEDEPDALVVGLEEVGAVEVLLAGL